jgi:hypothetical protein
VKFELAVMRLLFEYLRSCAGLHRPSLQNEISAADALLQRYEDHLRKDRGLTENSVLVYTPFIRDFLTAQTTQTGCVSPESFDALTIRSFILEHTTDRSSEYTRLLCTALRSFLRFLVLCGLMLRDLSNSVPMVRKYRQAVVPAFLSPDEVERVLKATNPSALSGHRDHAILLPLLDSGCARGKSSRSTWTIYAGGPARSSSTAKAGWWTTCRWYRTLVKLWLCTFRKTVALVRRGGSSYEYGRRALV